MMNSYLVRHLKRLVPLNAVKTTIQLCILPLGLGAVGGFLRAHAQEINTSLPAPIVNESTTGPHETVVLSGGCFWGVQGVFQHVKGVNRAVSGYTGGSSNTAQYEIVSTGKTGHAESVLIDFNPQQISLGELLRIYFSVAHDPTERNYQGPDRGTQYRSAIWTTNDGQTRVARAYIDQLGKAGVFSAPIVTQVNPLKAFYPAEHYHQDYLTLNPDNPYIIVNDLPKVEHLKQVFPSDYRAVPVLVESHQ